MSEEAMQVRYPLLHRQILRFGTKDWKLRAILVAAGVLLFGVLVIFGSRTLMRGEAPEPVTINETAALTPNQVGDVLLRSGVGANGSALDVLYAPEWYFRWNQRELPQTEVPVLAFFVMEAIHQGDLLGDPPEVLLLVDNKQYEPIETRVVSDAPHHRVSQVLFSALDKIGGPLITEQDDRIALVSPIGGIVTSSNTFSWDLPLPHGLGLIGDPIQGDGLTAEVVAKPALTLPAALAIMGGMLAALSPCLLQLAAYYAAVLAGAGAQSGGIAAPRRYLLRTGLFFIAGFTAIYTVGGLAAGSIGASLQHLEFVQRWSRPISAVAGVLIIVLAFRVAVQAKAPLVCRLPIKTKDATSSGWWSSALMGSTFAIGCLSCFSATVLTALLLYAGSTGSPITGATLLFLFSSGVGVVFLVAAWALGEAGPMMDWLHRAQPAIGGVSALIMAGFGLLMVTYQFHVVSGFLLKVFTSS
jgi:cytochrome c-type biogenesis protein